MVVASPRKVECNLPFDWPAVRVSMTKERCMKHECEHRSPGHGAYSKGEGHAAGPDNHKPAPEQTASRAPPGLDSATCYTNMLNLTHQAPSDPTCGRLTQRPTNL